MSTYKEKDLRELYRIDNKYWTTGDTDLLEGRIAAARKIDERFWDDVAGMVAIATKKHLPVKVLIEALALLGFEVEEKEKEEN